MAKKIPVPSSAAEYYDWLNAEEGPRLDRALAVKHGNPAALYDACADALVESQGDAVTIPRWALESLFDLLRADMEGSRHSRSQRRHRSDLIDWHRFNQVVCLLIGSDYPDHRSKSQQRADRIKRFKQTGHVDTSTPHPWSANSVPGDLTAFEAASHILAGSAYSGRPATIEKSFNRVREALGRGEWWRYYPSRYVRYPRLHRTSLDSVPTNFPRKSR